MTKLGPVIVDEHGIVQQRGWFGFRPAVNVPWEAIEAWSTGEAVLRSSTGREEVIDEFLELHCRGKIEFLKRTTLGGKNYRRLVEEVRSRMPDKWTQSVMDRKQQ